ncbi:hypothetical protein, partial [Vibrio cholerae]|uniref:hypothetical protein n=1 Tax=Vibrio cholerae TaxID=666 RepID=UPI001C8EF684
GKDGLGYKPSLKGMNWLSLLIHQTCDQETGHWLPLLMFILLKLIAPFSGLIGLLSPVND